jgi:DNA-directed RNA polymerase subunit RPC12/RpoP
VPETTADLRVVAEAYHCSDCGHYHANYVCPGCGRRNDDWGPEPGDNRQRCLGCGRWLVVYCDPAEMP